MFSNTHIFRRLAYGMGDAVFCLLPDHACLAVAFDGSAKETNQVALTMWPVNQAGICGVLVRSNSPDSHWTIFGPYFGKTNQTISVTCDLAEGMTIQTLTN